MPELGNFLKSLLQEQKLNLVDVGATGGPELRWKKWQDLCFFHTFDPDPRADPWNGSSKNYPIGLWSHKCSQTLHLASYPPASSLFLPNQEWTGSFSVNIESVGTRRIDLCTMDSLLRNQIIDFIKIDAEGAELEILKGGQTTLNSCLGFQLEVLFCPIRHNAPTFADLDSFVRNYDFQLFQIQREHWLRKNKIAFFESTPQLIWGNVLYLIPKKIFLSRLKQNPQPGILFAKYMLILFAYNLYDYAYELCEEVPLEEGSQLKHLLSKLSTSKKELLKLLLSLAAGGGKYAWAFTKKKKQDRLSYLRRKVRQLGKACLYFGRNDFAIYD
jgi:hypothetical protein